MPPAATAEMAMGFTLFMVNAVMTDGDRAVAPMRSSTSREATCGAG
jgi:hypothetical protein